MYQRQLFEFESVIEDIVKCVLPKTLFIELLENLKVICMKMVVTFSGNGHLVERATAICGLESTLGILVHLEVFDGNTPLDDPSDLALYFLQIREFFPRLVDLRHTQVFTALQNGTYLYWFQTFLRNLFSSCCGEASYKQLIRDGNSRSSQALRITDASCCWAVRAVSLSFDMPINIPNYSSSAHSYLQTVDANT